MARFPTVESLAAATPADVLREWQGLGYDRRGIEPVAGGADHRPRPRRPRAVDVATLEALPGRRAVHGPRRGGDRLRRTGRRGRHQRPAGADADDRRWRRHAAREGRPGAGRRVRSARRARRLDARRDGPRGDRLPRRPDRAADRARRDRGAARRRPEADGRPTRPAAQTRPPSRHAATVPFPSTARWLRGRVARPSPRGGRRALVAIEAPIGVHDRRRWAAPLDGAGP